MEWRIFSLMCLCTALGVGVSILMSSDLVRGISAGGLAILGVGVLIGSAR